MARYIEQPTINKTENGKRYYETVIPQEPQLAEFPLEYVATMGDRWDNLAYKFYGNAALWYVIASANGGYNGSIFVKPGTKIVVPEV